MMATFHALCVPEVAIAIQSSDCSVSFRVQFGKRHAVDLKFIAPELEGRCSTSEAICAYSDCDCTSNKQGKAYLDIILAE